MKNKAYILKSLIISMIVGFIIVFVAILPAEYNIDPTGLGEAIGFKSLYQETEKEVIVEYKDKEYPSLKMEDAGSKPSVKIPKEYYNPAPNKQFEEREDVVEIKLGAKKGVEYKVDMLKYGKLKYEWKVAETVFFDFHGEVKEKNPPRNVFYESYTVAYSKNMIGTFTSPFEGKQGWYFKNLTDKEIVIKLKLKGQYKLKK
jgi:hypothetical protein